MPGLVIQSHTDPLPHPWLQRCIDSVRNWAQSNHLEYRWIGDDLFKQVPPEIASKFSAQIVITSDLARLQALRQALDEGFDPVLWLDCDFFLFNAKAFRLPEADYAVGRELWIQTAGNGKLKSYRRVHNAFLMFRQGNSFLDFYRETATRLLRQLDGPVPPQFIGPKLLSALHNICQLPVMEQAGMLSPLVMQDIRRGSGQALTTLRKLSEQQMAGANLCSSLAENSASGDSAMREVMDNLQKGIL